MAVNKRESSVSPIAEEARVRLQLAIDADDGNRAAAMEDIKFSSGEQWNAADAAQRKLEGRPMLTINKTDTFVRNVVNGMRQQRPRIKVHPVSDGAAIAEAKIIDGLIRHIEVNSNADLAYDTGADFQVRGGWGYWRVASRYVDQDSFDQELYIDRVRNPFSVYIDPSSTAPDGSDAMWYVITDRMRKKEFELRYPGKPLNDFKSPGIGDHGAQWQGRQEILIAEYWRIDEVQEDLFQLSNGKTCFRSDKQMNPFGAKEKGHLASDSVMVIDVRKSMKRVVKWSKVSGTQELESREWPGKWIPIVPVYGAELLDDGKVIRYGMVRQLKDPARMYNYMRTKEAEYVGLAVMATWVGPKGFAESSMNDWRNVNRRNMAYLEWDIVHDQNGQPMPAPERIHPQAIPAASVHAAMAASEDLKAVAGMFDPALGAQGNETSGKMVERRQNQSDLSNFHFYDNLTRSIRFTGHILLDLIPHYYNDERVIRIIGEDGVPETVTINEKSVGKVLNDISVGRYDVVMQTGPGYDTKRLESVDATVSLFKELPEHLKEAIADLMVRQMDFPGADKLADRLAMANPLAKIDKELPKDLDPKAKQMLAQAMAQVQQLQKQLQELSQEKQAKVFGVMEREKAIGDREKVKEDAETHRLHVRELGEDERLEKELHVRLHDASLKASTNLQETLIDAHTDLAIAHKQAMERGKPKVDHD